MSEDWEPMPMYSVTLLIDGLNGKFFTVWLFRLAWGCNLRSYTHQPVKILVFAESGAQGVQKCNRVQQVCTHESIFCWLSVFYIHFNITYLLSPWIKLLEMQVIAASNLCHRRAQERSSFCMYQPWFFTHSCFSCSSSMWTWLHIHTNCPSVYEWYHFWHWKQHSTWFIVLQHPLYWEDSSQWLQWLGAQCQSWRS